jgi:hypothetical protein
LFGNFGIELFLIDVELFLRLPFIEECGERGGERGGDNRGIDCVDKECGERGGENRGIDCVDKECVDKEFGESVIVDKEDGGVTPFVCIFTLVLSLNICS